ncbi:hypothetical protein SAMN05216419_100554 [Nitrosomonas cryotolerans]|uniref:Type II secretory pathway, pseudopilin PulG n=1 Tax=Nitrosomonas cryotolerans ATCC 49181 TaxID=1131553 RepID=A0A1N6G5J0_9PROT|nr:type II secretion system protein [Nitrosomonas cryotolerans]SFP52225.1 hypothetical protein SAMN05216419_100554 [Nitrosomonas cryotolerans]SIO02662.1 hypothetical protein SAMN02743940_0555 [Nitrosomonas cryotolerans ATCC 49181]
MISSEKGFIYIWALFAVALAGIVMAGTGQVWQTKSQRDKEKELLFIGEQFQKAITSYYDSSPGGAKKYPESLEKLLEDDRFPTTRRHLRKIFLDPMTNSYEWGLIAEPVPERAGSEMSLSRANVGIIGVYSLSDQSPIKIGGFPEDLASFSEAVTYQDWQFVYTQGGAEQKSSSGKGSGASSPSSGSPFSSGSNSGGAPSGSPFSSGSDSGGASSGSPFSSGSDSGGASSGPSF